MENHIEAPKSSAEKEAQDLLNLAKAWGTGNGVLSGKSLVLEAFQEMPDNPNIRRVVDEVLGWDRE